MDRHQMHKNLAGPNSWQLDPQKRCERPWCIGLCYFFYEHKGSHVFPQALASWETALGHWRGRFHSQKELPLQAGPFQTAAEAREDRWPESTHNFLCDKSSVNLGVRDFCKISCTALQYKCLSFIDVPSSAGTLNESPLVDKFGSIKNSVVYLHNKHYQALSWILAYSSLSLPSGLNTYFIW